MDFPHHRNRHQRIRQQRRRPNAARMTTANLDLVRLRASQDRYLAVLITMSQRGEPQVSVVNATVIAHPIDGHDVVAFVARGNTAKLTNLRRQPTATVVFRAGWEWVAVAGPVQLAGPDDPLDGVGPHDLPPLLRNIFHAADGHHEDLSTYDRVMRDERRCAVLIEPTRIWSNPIGTEHQDPT
jgi:PPOX class probable F420-dependent enzyme